MGSQICSIGLCFCFSANTMLFETLTSWGVGNNILTCFFISHVSQILIALSEYLVLDYSFFFLLSVFHSFFFHYSYHRNNFLEVLLYSQKIFRLNYKIDLFLYLLLLLLEAHIFIFYFAGIHSQKVFSEKFYCKVSESLNF